MKKLLGVLMVLLGGGLLYVMLDSAIPGYQIEGIPENLVIVYDFGATHAAWGRTRYVVTADGKIEKFDLQGIPMQGAKPASTFSVSPEGLKRIIDAINRTRFFSLAPQYADPSIMDGSSHYISVQAGSASHMVSARNTSVDALNRISAAILAEVR